MSISPLPLLKQMLHTLLAYTIFGFELSRRTLSVIATFRIQLHAQDLLIQPLGSRLSLPCGECRQPHWLLRDGHCVIGSDYLSLERIPEHLVRVNKIRHEDSLVAVSCKKVHGRGAPLPGEGVGA